MIRVVSMMIILLSVQWVDGQSIPKSIDVNCQSQTMKYNINFVNSSRCLSDEYTILINNVWLACAPNLDTFSTQTSLIVNTLCNGNSADFLSDYPNQKITCGIHIINFIPTSLCLQTELGVFIDSVFFWCIPQDDSYSNNVMHVVGAYCGSGSLAITVAESS